MNRIVSLALLLGGLSQAAGCVITSGDESATFDVSWALLAAEDGSEVSCPPDATTAEVVSVLQGASCPGPDCFVDCFDCSTGGGITAELPLGDYDVSVNITDADPSECGVGSPALIAQSDLQQGDLVADGQVVPLTFDFTVDGGFFQAAWTLSDAGGDLSCGDVTQNGVGVLSTLVGPDTAYDDQFDCEGDGTCGAQCGTTSALPVGDYEVVVDLLDDNNASIATCGDQMSRTIDFGNQLVDLGTVDCLIQ